MPQQNQRRGELEHPEKVFCVTFIPNDQTPEVLQPGKKPLDFPAPLVSLQPTSILGTGRAFLRKPEIGDASVRSAFLKERFRRTGSRIRTLEVCLFLSLASHRPDLLRVLANVSKAIKRNGQGGNSCLL